jgi:hypothetical protein
MASILKVDDLRGNAAADNITITDGSVTMKLQNGLVKCSLSGDFSDGSTSGGAILRGLNINRSILPNHLYKSVFCGRPYRHSSEWLKCSL